MDIQERNNEYDTRNSKFIQLVSPSTSYTIIKETIEEHPNMDKIRQKLLKYINERNIVKIKNLINKYHKRFENQELIMLENYDQTYSIKIFNLRNTIESYKNRRLLIDKYVISQVKDVLDRIDVLNHQEDILDLAGQDICLILSNNSNPNIANFILSNIKFTKPIFNSLYTWLVSNYNPIIHILKYQLEETISFIENVNNLFEKNIPFFGLDLFDSIIANASFCKRFKNEVNLVGDTWDDVFSETESNNIVYYDKNSGYGFLINSLLNYWNSKFNSCNHLICPSLPTNPYTNQVIPFDDIYKISYVALRYNIEIPKTMKQILMFPELLDKIRSYQSKNIKYGEM